MFIKSGVKLTITNFDVQVLEHASYVLCHAAEVEITISGIVHQKKSYMIFFDEFSDLFLESIEDNRIQVFPNFTKRYIPNIDELCEQIDVPFTMIRKKQISIDISRQYNFFVKDDNDNLFSSIQNLYMIY